MEATGFLLHYNISVYISVCHNVWEYWPVVWSDPHLVINQSVLLTQHATPNGKWICILYSTRESFIGRSRDTHTVFHCSLMPFKYEIYILQCIGYQV